MALTVHWPFAFCQLLTVHIYRVFTLCWGCARHFARIITKCDPHNNQSSPHSTSKPLRLGGVTDQSQWALDQEAQVGPVLTTARVSGSLGGRSDPKTLPLLIPSFKIGPRPIHLTQVYLLVTSIGCAAENLPHRHYGV